MYIHLLQIKDTNKYNFETRTYIVTNNIILIFGTSVSFRLSYLNTYET